MRAATLIVGAIAAASILIALAFVLSGGSSSSTVRTTTVIDEVEAKAPVERETAGGEGGSRDFGGLQECGRELTVENLSCEIGEEVHGEYEQGQRESFRPEDPETGERLKFTCGAPTPVMFSRV